MATRARHGHRDWGGVPRLIRTIIIPLIVLAIMMSLMSPIFTKLHIGAMTAQSQGAIPVLRNAGQLSAAEAASRGPDMRRRMTVQYSNRSKAPPATTEAPPATTEATVTPTGPSQASGDATGGDEKREAIDSGVWRQLVADMQSSEDAVYEFPTMQTQGKSYLVSRPYSVATEPESA